jgi:hypothetical protein
LNCLKRQLGIKLVNLLDHHVDRLSWLAFLGTILMTLRAFAADESSNKPPPTTLIIAAAADLKFALDDLVKEFEEKNSAIKVNVTYGSSGNFFAQLENGAPFDLFFSADVDYPRNDSTMRPLMVLRFYDPLMVYNHDRLEPVTVINFSEFERSFSQFHPSDDCRNRAGRFCPSSGRKQPLDNLGINSYKVAQLI